MPSRNRLLLVAALVGIFVLMSVSAAFALGDEPQAPITNDEGGPVLITGSVTYTNSFFTAGVAEPEVILEDEAGFVDRNKHFIMPVASQTLGQITSDFFTSPFTYSISLPIEPQGSLRDVDHNGVTDPGVMVFAMAYWTNTFGDPYLETRDLYGGGWSTAYTSVRISNDAATKDEFIGGKVLIYAPEPGQGFPSGFGADGLLFTDDDPIVIVPQGYTIVNMDSDPFTFDRSKHAVVDLIEGEGAAASDFSSMSYTDAFDAMINKMSHEYAFTELKNIDWQALSDEFRPKFEAAQQANDDTAYQYALEQFTWAIPDAHVGTSAFDVNRFQTETGGGLGMAIRDIDDGRVIVNYILSGGPADQAGIKLRAEITELNGTPINDAIDANVPWSSPFSTEHVRRLQQLRYVLRFPVGTDVTVTYKNPGDTTTSTATMTTVAERQSFAFSSFNVGLSGYELPLDYHVLDSGYVYVQIYSFFDNELLTIQEWERLMQNLNDNNAPGLIIDMRQNSGGNGFLADQMAAYFFDEPLDLGNSATYDKKSDSFYVDPRGEQQFYLPADNLRYHGPIAVLVGPSCASACEFFSYDMTLQDRASIVGQYPTAGAGGSVEAFYMPGGQTVQFPIARNMDPQGNIIIEGKGVVPTVKVPVNMDTLFSTGDVVLDAAVSHLNEATTANIIQGDPIAVGETVTGTLEAGSRANHTLDMSAGGTINIVIQSDIGAYVNILDTDGNVLADGTSPSDPGWEQLQVPAGFVLVLQVVTEGDAGSGDYTLSVEDASASGS